MLPSGGVTFPKLVVHAALAGLYGGLVVALFVGLANRADAPDGTGPGLTGLFVVLTYTLAAAIIWPVLYISLRFFASHRLRLTWLSPRYVVGFHVVNTAVLLVAGWMMPSEFRSTLAPPDADRVTSACVWLTLAWLAGLLVATVPALRRRARLQAAAGGLALASLVLSLSGGPERGLRSPQAGAPRAGLSLEQGSAGTAAGVPARRLLLLNFDGADLDTILTMQAQGRLPAFSRLVEEGTYGRLASVLPCVAPVTRTILVTGMLPYRNGVRGAESRSVLGRDPWLDVVPPGIGFDVLLSPVLERRAASVSDRRVPALWEISARLGGSGEAAGWDVDLDAVRPGTTISSPQAAPDAVADLIDPEVLRQKDPAARLLLLEIARAAAADGEVLEPLRRFETRAGRGAVAVSFPGLDRLAHVFLRYARPADFGNVSPRDVDLYGPVLERYYRRIDGIVGRALQSGGAGTLLLVTATHGMEPSPPLRRLKGEILGGEHLSGVHDGAPPGFLFVHGPDARRGRVFGKGSIADVTPTALYALGLPVARDAHGSILAGVFSEAFTASHPVTVIGSYGTSR